MRESILDFADKLLDVILEIQALQDYDNRTMLLRHLPPKPVGFIKRSQATAADLNNIVTAVESWGQLADSGEWAIAIVAENALRFVKGTAQERELEALLASLETLPSSINLAPVEEIVIGRDERLPISFLESALAASRAVARILVPRVFMGKKDGSFAYGTGWLIAPGLLVTNHHVITARAFGEPQVDETDLQIQVIQSTVWFDYLERNQSYQERRCIDLVCSNAILDYAIVRLNVNPTTTTRRHLSVCKHPLSLHKGDRVNIIQHPQGGPKRIAIRSNFYLDSFSSPDTLHRFRYLTDTEPGSSGSPIFNDTWEVVGVHSASVQVPETQYKGEVLKYNNQGISIDAITENLPKEVFTEISKNQSW